MNPVWFDVQLSDWICVFVFSAGNKIDLDKDRHVSVEEAERWEPIEPEEEGDDDDGVCRGLSALINRLPLCFCAVMQSRWEPNTTTHQPS